MCFLCVAVAARGVAVWTSGLFVQCCYDFKGRAGDVLDMVGLSLHLNFYGFPCVFIMFINLIS